MIVIPAIDILDGKCVRLYKGEYNQVKVYNDHPLDQAKQFEDLGIKRLHIVDLDGAKAGRPVNKEQIKSICSKTSLIIEVGGGIRTFETVKEYVDLGVSRIILGSALVKNPELVDKVIKEYSNGLLIAGIDFKDNQFAISGWLESTDKTPMDFAIELKAKGVNEYIFTDISKDGTLEGSNVPFYKEAIQKLGKGVIASGGIGSDDHIKALSELKDLAGVIVGKAYYENKVDLTKWV